MKKITALAGLSLVFGLVLTGCSDNTPQENDPTASQTETSESEVLAVSETLNTYYKTMVEQSGASMEVSDDVETAIREVTGDDTYEAFSSTNNPFTAFDEISDEQAKELADRIEELNPISNLFDYSQMNDRDRAVLNLLNIASSIMLTSIQEQEIEISVQDSAINIDGNTASIPYSQMTFIVGDSETPMADALGGTEFHAIKIDGGWKVDGQKTYESTKNSALGEVQASDGGGSSDNGEG